MSSFFELAFWKKEKKEPGRKYQQQPIRDIHPSRYGHICPIDTFKGIKARVTVYQKHRSSKSHKTMHQWQSVPPQPRGRSESIGHE
ncbi:hypothetical protein G4B88_019353 [Cannabis sativa]|uniref:DNA-directed RNA polymerase n=1 Tax=Cannabis sativa TaxID=3483 RepID=A0A7J6HXY1_CANSA|nr:hypothetical protein G4B88_019353 [Cannabis sativa]